MRIDFDTLNEINETFGEYSINFVGKRCYLRFGYWQRINMQTLTKLFHGQILVEEIDMYDDDCGYLYHYTLEDKHGL